MDDERVAANLDRDPVERGGRAARLGERRDSGRQLDLERSVDADLLEAGDAEIAGCRAGGRGDSDAVRRQEGRCACAAPSQSMVKTPLRAADVARPGLLIEHLAPPETSTSPEPMMLTSAVPLECALMLPEPAIETFACCVWTRAGIDIARAGDVVVGALRLAGARLGAARSGDRQLQRSDVERCDVEPARAGDRAVEAIALDAVDLDVARTGDGRAAESAGRSR